MANGTQAKPNWHELNLPALFEAVNGSAAGLSEAEAQKRLAQFGPNQLPQQPPPPWWLLLLRQFNSPLIYILAIAVVVSVAIGDFTDAGFIAAVLAVNALIGGYQEWRAEQSSRALQQLLHIRATVVRDGEAREVDAEEVVPGDVVWLESGNRVPADLRLLQAHGTEIDESFLTGESLAVVKDPAWTGEAAAPVADRRNLAFAGAIVVRGRAKGLVVATGNQTVVGQLAKDVLSTVGGRPPLLERMERFAHVVAVAVLVAVVALAGYGIAVLHYGVGEMFMFSVALAVSAIPEGLPAALTVALAIATARMARRGVIVRRLAAVEGLGSCTLIASDKTGTLTCNELTVREIRVPGSAPLEVSGEGFAPHGEVRLQGQALRAAENQELARLAQAAVLCNEGDLHQRDGAWVWRGDPTDLALLAMAHKLGLTREVVLAAFPQVNQIPFEPERQFAATFHEVAGAPRVMVKGAPERLLAMCAPASADAEGWRVAAEAMAERGYRVLALAEGPAASAALEQTPAEPTGLTFLGLVGMIDPLRAGVKEAVAACHQAGITVSMITGDHPVTALAIARDLGFADRPDQVVAGRELEGMTPDELTACIQRVRVFARTTPRQKLELVNAARRAGHFVAVTGDGVNDAPALRAANIGVAMGKSGTDVAREAAELVISDDNFATIVAGVEEGRVAYDNVRKVIYLLISTGAAEVLLVGLALIAGAALPLPLIAVQLLWLNLVTNGIQGIALAFEPSEGDVLGRKPRPPGEPIFNRLMLERTVVAAVVMAAIGLTTFWWFAPQPGEPDHERKTEAARNILLLLMVLFENIHIGNCRSETKSALSLSPFRSPFLLGGAIAAFLLHVAAMHLPVLQRVLRTEPVDGPTWLLLIALALTIFVALEIHKWSWARRHPEPP